MQQLFLNVINAVLGIWRFRWTALIVTWIVAMLGWLAVELLPHKYSSQAKLFVDTNQVLEPLLRDITVQLNVTQRVALMGRALLTRPNIMRVAAESGLDQEEWIETEDDLQALYRGMERNLKLYQPGREQTLWVVSFDHTDPAMAKRVVDTLVEIFIESSLGDERKDDEQTKEFLDSRIAEYEIRLIDAEARLAKFKRNNTGSMPTEAGDFYRRLQLSEERLAEAERELREASYRRDELERQLDKVSPVIIVAGGGETKKEIAKLREEREELLQRYTALHPRAQQLEGRIGVLTAKLRTEAAQPGRSTGRRNNPAYEKLQPIVAEAHGSVAELEIRVEDYRSQVEQLRSAVERVPAVEAALKELDRDYLTIKEQHETLLEKRESAQLSILERGNDKTKFQIIEPALVAMRPSSPNKPIFHFGVLLVALGAGLGLAILMSIFKPVYFDQRTLQMQTGLPVFGSVTMHRSAEAKQRHRVANIGYTAATVLLPVMLILLIAVNLGG